MTRQQVYVLSAIGSSVFTNIWCWNISWWNDRTKECYAIRVRFLLVLMKLASNRANTVLPHAIIVRSIVRSSWACQKGSKKKYCLASSNISFVSKISYFKDIQRREWKVSKFWFHEFPSWEFFWHLLNKKISNSL